VFAPFDFDFYRLEKNKGVVFDCFNGKLEALKFKPSGC
jgi:hypothetical protein